MGLKPISPETPASVSKEIQKCQSPRTLNHTATNPSREEDLKHQPISDHAGSVASWGNSVACTPMNVPIFAKVAAKLIARSFPGHSIGQYVRNIRTITRLPWEPWLNSPGFKIALIEGVGIQDDCWVCTCSSQLRAQRLRAFRVQSLAFGIRYRAVL